jgi:excisionase family DNA binding protein
MLTPDDKEILNASGAAKALGISRRLLLRLARQGVIPGKKLGREWRFLRSHLRETVAGAVQVEGAMAALKRAGVRFLPRP